MQCSSAFYRGTEASAIHFIISAPARFLAHTCSVILRARQVSLVAQPQAMKGFGSNPTVLHIFNIIRYCQKYPSYHLCWSTYPSYFLYMRINSFPGSGSALVRSLRLPGGFLLSKRLRDLGASRNKHKFPACWRIGSNKEGEINVRGLTSDMRSAGRRASVSMLQRHSQLLPRQQSSANLLFSEPPDVKKGVNWHMSPSLAAAVIGLSLFWSRRCSAFGSLGPG